MRNKFVFAFNLHVILRTIKVEVWHLAKPCINIFQPGFSVLESPLSQCKHYQVVFRLSANLIPPKIWILRVTVDTILFLGFTCLTDCCCNNSSAPPMALSSGALGLASPGVTTQTLKVHWCVWSSSHVFSKVIENNLPKLVTLRIAKIRFHVICDLFRPQRIHPVSVWMG